MHWEKYPHKKIKQTVFDALKKNLDYRTEDVLGLPATYLDPEVFYQDAPFLKDAPYMQTMVANPNHIGCHTLGDAEPAFLGTQAIEKELIGICATQIFSAKEQNYDGYVASGGTEANIESLWVHRNLYMREYGAQAHEIAVVYSADTHYSIPKGVNLLQLQSVLLPVEDDTREIDFDAMRARMHKAQSDGLKYFILIMNMSTTMFGSVDNVEQAMEIMEGLPCEYRIHVDGAYGGFIYPFTRTNESLTFKNPKINSFSIDAHKLVQSPYGTGICLLRKGLIEYALTDEAEYVKGKDYTLVGSRSGANAIAVWMILRTYGSEGWKAKILKLIDRTDRLCENLDERGIRYFRNPAMNIVAIRAEDIPETIAHEYLLVPDTHESKPNWLKIVVMEHVTQGKIDKFLFALDGWKQ
ncbi:tyrosine decarboxylase/aspartate 1-decarboxylase [Catalinimonas alkaloidigena]|uniref:aminotransferase class I/II-fold pyridoxal phosphate-dependent enzyme n=1 Tax=Catalinimonas alkaloidigena TaxID=1075417 RepID=UPI0024059378|nr:aminotransferase class I/II-fold pyridoxal phosphate-dependent enzyme [Catalinimonas alkaloidigena]MDF9797045.1 tyrosine decarboxylase/aspartate 1-decarboxylase [Catalinimonas alkaloidigena]